MKRLLAAIFTAGMLFFAPNANALTLDEVEGLWQLDYETTIAKTDDQFLKEAMVDEENRPDAFTVTISKAAMTMTLMIGSLDENVPEEIVFTMPAEAEASQVPADGIVLVTEDGSHLYIEKIASGIKIGETKDLGKTSKDVLYFKR